MNKLIMPRCYIYGLGVKEILNSTPHGELWLSNWNEGYFLFFGEVKMMQINRIDFEQPNHTLFNGAWE